jgi:predicted neuraminidase
MKLLALIGLVASLLIACTNTSNLNQSVEPHPAILQAGFVFEEAPFPECHASTLAATPAGMVIAWFGGTHEKHEDVEIWVSHQKQSGWSAPVSVAHGVQADGNRFPCWNPVLYQLPGGPLYLFYKVGPNPREWWGEWKKSDDGGHSWSEAERIPDGNLGPVRNKPILLANGKLLCGSSTEADSLGWRVFMETFDPRTETWSHTSLLHDRSHSAIQPTLLTYADGRIQALCRSKKSGVLALWSDDQGESWGEIQETVLPNPNSGIDGVSLQDGRQLLVYNHTQTKVGQWGGERSPLNVGLSKDGLDWASSLALEDEKGAEFSYPAVIQTVDGKVHIVYTWKRKRIKYVVLDPKML